MTETLIVKIFGLSNYPMGCISCMLRQWVFTPLVVDPKASKKEAPVVLCLPQQGIRLPDGRVAFANREFEVRRGERCYGRLKSV